MSGFSFGTGIGTPSGGFSFATPASTAASASGMQGFSFGNPSASTAPTAAPALSSGLFGTAASTAASAPQGGFSFAGASNASTAVAPTAPTAGFSFGKPTATGTGSAISPFTASTNIQAPPPASTSTAGFSFLANSSTGTSGGTLFGTTSSSNIPTAQPIVSNPLTSSTPSPFGLGVASGSVGLSGVLGSQPPLSTATPPPAISTTFGVASPAAPVSFSGFGANAAPSSGFSGFTQTTPAAASTASATGGSLFSLGGTTSSAPATTTLTTMGGGFPATNVATTIPPVAPTLCLRELEEKVNRWLVELQEQEERFLRQASHVTQWDQVLQKGHDQVAQLKDTMNTLKSDQSRLEAELDFIKGQQDELERLIEPMENALVTNDQSKQMHQGDRQRDSMYHLAQNLDGELRQMTSDLTKVIEHLNTFSGPGQTSDPVAQVGRIISAHMDTLRWVDQNTSQLSTKMEEISRSIGENGYRD